jgi:hypothetical protein
MFSGVGKEGRICLSHHRKARTANAWPGLPTGTGDTGTDALTGEEFKQNDRITDG